MNFECPKVRFATRKEAKRHAKRTRDVPGRRRKVRAYGCPDCGGFHVTTVNTATTTFYRERRP